MIKERKFMVKMTTLEPFRVGGKADPLGPENPVATVGDRVVVPGSSLKGALRHALERYLIDQHYDRGAGSWKQAAREMQPCMASTKRLLSKDEKELIGRGLYRDESCHYPCTSRSCGEKQHTICPVCYLLGAQGLVGFVRVPFLTSDVPTNELYSARMDRAIGTVAGGTNRPYELVPDQASFTGTLYVMTSDDVLDWELGKPRTLKDATGGDKWLDGWTSDKIVSNLIVGVLQNISILGGYKSKGFGKVKIEVSETD
jgi:CRISPR/Cas system CSM-associated protein Csm3 (group 7 of RAMP superfamily)